MQPNWTIGVFWLHTGNSLVDTLERLDSLAEALNPQSLSKAASISGSEDSFVACQEIELELESDRANVLRDRQPSYYRQ
jgi:hypothetical protein